MIEVQEPTEVLALRLNPMVKGEPTSATSTDGKWHILADSLSTRIEEVAAQTYTISYAEFGVKLDLYSGVNLFQVIALLQTASGIQDVQILPERGPTS